MVHMPLWILLVALLTLPGSGLAQQPTSEIRRVVTTLNPSGKAVAMIEGVVPLARNPRTTNSAVNIWVTEKYPPDFSSASDRGKTRIGVPPPKDGTVFRIVEFPPIAREVEQGDVNFFMNVIGDHAPAKGLPPRHPMMHRTRSLDYAIVISGEIDMLLDDSEVHLKAGDVVVQQATNHAWVNRGGSICRIAFVLMDAREP
jgi:hypothetical protein